VTTAAANGKVLEELLGSIERADLHYVGIVATDPRDVIFLAVSIRERCPGVQIFTIGSDLLYTLPEFSYYLKGMVVGSTYPLLAENQRWTEPPERLPRILFPNEQAQGYYNAVRIQLNAYKEKKHQHFRLLEYAAPRFPEDVLPEGRYWPPVWITMIGQNGDVVPLDFKPKLDPTFDEDRPDYLWPRSKLPGVKVNAMKLAFPGTTAMLLFLLVVAVVVVLVYAFGYGGPRLFFHEGAALTDDWRRLVFWETLGFRLVCLGALTFLALYVADLWTIWFLSCEGEAWPAAGFVVAWLLPLLLVLAVPGRLLGRWLRASGKHLPAVPVVTTVILILLSARYLTWVLEWIGDTGLKPKRALYFERAMDLTTGASPLMPVALLCATFFFWALFQLKRIHLTQRFGVPCPYPKPEQGATEGQQFNDLSKSDDRLTEELPSSLKFIWRHPWWLLLVTGLVAVGAVRVVRLHVPIPEAAGWSRLLLCGFIAGYFLTAVSFARFLLLWSQIKKLLHEITLIPMMGAFEHLPARVRSFFGGHLYTGRPRLDDLRLPLHQLELLRAETQHLLAKTGSQAVQKHAKDLEEVAAEIQAFADDLRAVQGRESTAADEQRLWRKYSDLSRHLLRLLPLCWPRHTVDEAFGTYTTSVPGTASSEKEKKEKPAALFDDWVGLAESSVATGATLYVSQFFAQLRTLVWSLTLCSTLLLLGVTSYPFNPGRLLLMFQLGLVVAVVGGVVRVLFQINKNDLVSRIIGTTPNRFNLDVGFIGSLFSYVLPTARIVCKELEA
jgi:hypothetical protein